MGDVGDDFNAWKEARKKQKERYQQNDLPKDMALLRTLDGIEIEAEYNGGEHMLLAVNGSSGVREVDYWPSTGYWKVRAGNASGYRITNLQRYFKLGESK